MDEPRWGKPRVSDSSPLVSVPPESFSLTHRVCLSLFSHKDCDRFVPDRGLFRREDPSHPNQAMTSANAVPKRSGQACTRCRQQKVCSSQAAACFSFLGAN